MRRLLVICSALLLTAQAPASNPVMTHYTAYHTAMAAGDKATAETEAQAALQASVARDGNGGRTGVLAVNAAMAQLDNGHDAAAYEPAALALNIAQSAPSPALDPVLIRLLLGQAELGSGREGSGRTRLAEALEAARGNPEITGAAYAAAMALASWCWDHSRYGDAAFGWDYAAQFIDGAPGNHDLNLAEVRISEGIASFSDVVAMENRRLLASASASGSHDNVIDLDSIISPERYRPAAAAFTEGKRLLEPFAFQMGANNDLTLAQIGYARALAGRSLIAARLGRGDVDWRALFGAPSEADAARDAECPIRIIMEPAPRYPQSIANLGAFGVVVVRVLMQPDGSVSDVRVAATIPEQPEFRQAVERVAGQWRAERLPDAPANCEFPHVRFMQLRFTLR